MDEDDEYTEDQSVQAAPMQGIDLVILALDTLGALARVNSAMWTDLTMLVCRHANYRVALRRFEREAALEIESLVSGE